MSSREAYLRDHHRNLFGNDKQAFFKKDKVDYTTTQRGNFNEKNLDATGVVTAGGAGGAQLQYMKGSDRTTGATYSEVKNTDDQLVKMFREKLAQRGARGMLGL